MQDTAPARIKSAVIDLLQRRARKARFVPEIGAALDHSGATANEIEEALSQLEAAGAIIVRDNYCADPHLDGIDLRIAALVDGDGGDSDPQARALAAIDAIWQGWVGAYLANHRCT